MLKVEREEMGGAFAGPRIRTRQVPTSRSERVYWMHVVLSCDWLLLERAHTGMNEEK
jgi:hypothetical protein